MDFDLDETQRGWRARGTELGRALAGSPDPALVVPAAARAGLFDADVLLAAQAVAIEALGRESSAAGMVAALHAAAAGVMPGDEGNALRSADHVGALALSADEVPDLREGRLTGRAAWVAPITPHGIAVLGARASDGTVTACAVRLDTPGVAVEPIGTAGLRGLLCADLTLDGAASVSVGAAIPVMTRARILVSAAGLGIGRRALAEALGAAKRDRSAAAWEQTVQGLLADAATDLDAAALLLWKAAIDPTPTLGAASMAKLAVSLAAHRAVTHATQVIGADSFRQGHVVEVLTQDVRAFELFAGRTESLRDAIAVEILPGDRSGTG